MVSADAGRVIALADSVMGGGERRLGQALLANFLRLLGEPKAAPVKAVVCYNEGVKLVIDDSPVLAHIRALEAAGVPVVVCRTCVEYFDLEDRLVAGRLSNMREIQGLMMAHPVVLP